MLKTIKWRIVVVIITLFISAGIFLGSDKAKNVLNLILEKYVEYGLNQIRPDIISVEPIAQQGNAIEIVNEFGGIEEFKEAIDKLQILLYTDAA